MHHHLLAAALAALTAAEVTAQSWTLQLPAPFPNVSARRQAGMAFHPVQGGLVMYGGQQSSPALTLNDTWSFDGTTWTQLSPATTPPPRWGHRLVYDSRRACLVAFGGRSPTTTADANDTWEWNGVDWAQVVTANAPSRRAFYGMAFDERRGKTVLFGGGVGATITGSNQTWEYDGTDWTQVVTAFTPPGLESPAMTYDKGRGVVVMFGGWNASPATDYRTTWEYDGTNWVTRTTVNSPLTGYRTGCVYDDARGRVVLYGGYSSATVQQNVWEYDGNNWTNVLPAQGPGRITEALMAYDPIRQQSVYFGGSGPPVTGTGNNETWIYTGASTAIAAPFGRGCPTSVGTPALAPTTRPVIGQLYQLDLTGAPNASMGLVVHGFSNLQWSLGWLPADLTTLGIAGCRLEVRPDTSVFMAFPGGALSHVLPVPATATLANLPIYTQVFVFDASAPNGVGGATRAVHGVVGS